MNRVFNPLGYLYYNPKGLRKFLVFLMRVSCGLSVFFWKAKDSIFAISYLISNFVALFFRGIINNIEFRKKMRSGNRIKKMRKRAEKKREEIKIVRN